MVAQYAQTYIVVNLPGVYFMGQFDLAKRFLNCLRITWVPMVAQVGSTFLHLACCEIIVVRMGVQPIIGLGLASTVTSVSLFIMITIYANMIDNIKESIYWPDSSVWLGWKEYFALGVPTTGIMCAEYWAWQGLCIMSGNLSVNEQAIMMITVQIAWLVNTTCLGLQEAACVLVGIQIGAKDVPNAKHYALFTFCFSMTLAAIISSALYIGRFALAELFTSDEALLEATLKVIPFFCFTNLIDMAMCCFFGIVRALGIQGRVALLPIACYYAISIPLSAALAFRVGWGVMGLWVGHYIGIFCLTMIVVIMVVRTNWFDVVNEAEERMVEQRLLSEPDVVLRERMSTTKEDEEASNLLTKDSSNGGNGDTSREVYREIQRRQRDSVRAQQLYLALPTQE